MWASPCYANFAAAWYAPLHPPSSLEVGRLEFLEKSLLGGGSKTFTLVGKAVVLLGGEGGHIILK